MSGVQGVQVPTRDEDGPQGCTTSYGTRLYGYGCTVGLQDRLQVRLRLRLRYGTVVGWPGLTTRSRRKPRDGWLRRLLGLLGVRVGWLSVGWLSVTRLRKRVRVQGLTTTYDDDDQVRVQDVRLLGYSLYRYDSVGWVKRQALGRLSRPSPSQTQDEVQTGPGSRTTPLTVTVTVTVRVVVGCQCIS